MRYLLTLCLISTVCAIQCPSDLYIRTDAITTPPCDYINTKCCLPAPMYRVGPQYAADIKKGFAATQDFTWGQAEYNFQNLFHGHLIVDSAGELLLLLHAFEYPGLASINVPLDINLGYCQRNSTIVINTPAYLRRNVLFTLRTGHAHIVPCYDTLCTHYAEEFGTEIAQVLYMPPILNEVYAEPGVCH